MAAGGVGIGTFPVYGSNVTPTGPTPTPAVRPCGSCGIPDDRLEPVLRVYLDIDELGGVRELATLTEAEWWCPACRATYPHKPARAGADAAAGHRADTGGGADVDASNGDR